MVSVIIMNASDRHFEKNTIVKPALIILPAVLSGVFAMIAGHEPPVRCGLQLAAWLIFALAAWLLRHFALQVPVYIWVVLLLILLAATLFGHGTEGVRRWLDLGVISINASMLVLPALIIILYRMKFPYPFIICAAAILCFQPDISQLTGFCAGTLPLIWQRDTNRKWKAGMLLCFCILAGICLFIPAEILPVPYSEGILTMLGNISELWLTIGWAVLLIIPLFFGYGYCKQKSRPLLSLAIYYMVTILFILTGRYPVPFMGFGLSPIAGYWLAYAVMMPPGSAEDT